MTDLTEVASSLVNAVSAIEDLKSNALDKHKAMDLERLAIAQSIISHHGEAGLEGFVANTGDTVLSGANVLKGTVLPSEVSTTDLFFNTDTSQLYIGTVDGWVAVGASGEAQTVTESIDPLVLAQAVATELGQQVSLDAVSKVLTVGDETISLALATTSFDSETNVLTINNPDGSTSTVNMGGEGGVSIIENSFPSGAVLPDIAPPTGNNYFFLETSKRLYFWDGIAWVTAEPQATLSGLVADLPTEAIIGDMFFTTENQALMTFDGTEWIRVTPDPEELSASITAALDTTAIATQVLNDLDVTDLKGINIVTELPDVTDTSVSYAGAIVFLDSDAPTGQKLYFFSDHENDGTLTWESKVAFGDLTGSIAHDQIAANTIQSSHITAGSIDAAKIEANTITANQISAGAIGADQIAANSINGNKIAANSVYATHVVAGQIETGHMGANSIQGDRIQAGTLSAGKIDANGISCSYLNGGTANVTGGGFSLGGAGGSIGGHTGLAAFTSDGSKFGLISAGGAKDGIGCGTTSLTASAIVGVGEANSSYSSWKTVGALAHHGRGFHSVYQPDSTTTNQINKASLSTPTHAGYFEGDVYVETVVATFTGSHDALINPNTATEGDIVVDEVVVAKHSISDTIARVGISTTPNQKGAVGVFNCTRNKNEPMTFPSALRSTTLVESDSILPLEVREIKPEFKDVFDAHDLISINSLGEGQVNVCGEGGNLEIGDLIVTSSIQGKGKKQGDDIIRSTTVAKVRENVSFSSATEVKQVACIYLCG